MCVTEITGRILIKAKFAGSRFSFKLKCDRKYILMEVHFPGSLKLNWSQFFPEMDLGLIFTLQNGFLFQKNTSR